MVYIVIVSVLKTVKSCDCVSAAVCRIYGAS